MRLKHWVIGSGFALVAFIIGIGAGGAAGGASSSASLTTTVTVTTHGDQTVIDTKTVEGPPQTITETIPNTTIVKYHTRVKYRTPTVTAGGGGSPAGGGGSAAGGGTTSTVAQQQAVRSAQEYLSSQAFSRYALIQQLSSTYGAGFSKANAVYAVDHIKVDWNEQAARSAKEYLSSQAFSRSGLVQQLSSKYGAGFTYSQAVYGVNAAGL